jgi:phage terminase large subunit-like protein
VAGEVVTGKLVRAACERHLRDLEDGGKRGLHYDEDAAALAFEFFDLLTHSKGKWAGEAFVLEPWQKFVVGSLWGWRRGDGTRRFRVAHVEVARKNGKTTLAAGIGLLLFLVDGEAGAEVYTLATKKDQAKLAHGESVRMVRASRSLRKRVKVFKDNLCHEPSNSKYEPLGADSTTLDGLNVSGAIADELHAWKQRHLWDVVETATGAREQPLIFAITTAGMMDRNSIWWERRELAVKLLEGTPGFENDELFGYVATLDKGDDWRDPATWAKGNPSLGVSVKAEEIAKQVAEAARAPGKQNVVKRLRLNVPTEQVSRWLDMEVWILGGGEIDAEGLKGRECYGGLDLARVKDLSAFALLFPPAEEGEKWKLLVQFYCPEEGIMDRVRNDRVPYDRWRDQGWLTATPGNTTDFAFIAADVLAAAGRYDLRQVAFDRTFGGELINTLTNEGVPLLEWGQGFLSMAAPTAELERMLLGGELLHGGNPVLEWNAGNVTVKQDPAGNLKPDKAKSSEKIDGVVAAIMALGAAMQREPAATPTVEVW